MSSGLCSTLTDLIPLALIIALSPLSIIPAVLVLQTPRPRPTSLAFLAGWFLGLAALTTAATALSGLLGGLRGDPPDWTSWLRIAVGVALIAFGVYRWLTRHSAPHHLPGTDQITGATPVKAVAVGAALTVLNPKVLLMCLAAGLAVGASSLKVGGGLVAAIAVFVLIAAATVAIPVFAYAAFGQRLDPTLQRVKAWMEKHNGALVAAILVIIGLMVLYKGWHGL